MRNNNGKHILSANEVIKDKTDYGSAVDPLPELKKEPEKIMSKLVLVTVGDKPNIDLGISEVKKLIKAIKEIEEAYAIVMEDGKISIGDFTKSPIETIWQPATALFDLFKTKDLLLNQILRIDTNEAEELIAEVAKEFNMLPEKVLLKVSHAMKAVFHIGEIFKS